MEPIEEFDFELEQMDGLLSKDVSWESAANLAASSRRRVSAETLKQLYPRWADIAYGIADISE